MMLKIGVTGGIGSGKTTVCGVFRALGIPVYDADSEAKKLMITHEGLVRALKLAFGEEAYDTLGQLNRPYLASRVFNDEAALAQLNAIVHPVVIQAANDWAEVQNAPYTVKEAALLFQSGSYVHNDFNIVVAAPEALRISRVMERDGMAEAQVRARMDKQMHQEEQIAKADFVVWNDGVRALIPQVLELDRQFRNR